MLRIFIFVLLAMTCVHCSTSKKSNKTTSNQANSTEQAQNQEPAMHLTLEDRLRRISGVRVLGNGRDAKVVVRALSSLTNNAEALFVVDGVTISGGLLAASQLVNVNDIDDIRVLKSAMHTSLYGVQGAGGVIKITLKKE